jgi:hypothetical protein
MLLLLSQLLLDTDCCIMHAMPLFLLYTPLPLFLLYTPLLLFLRC